MVMGLMQIDLDSLNKKFFFSSNTQPSSLSSLNERINKRDYLHDRRSSLSLSPRAQIAFQSVASD